MWFVLVLTFLFFWRSRYLSACTSIFFWYHLKQSHCHHISKCWLKKSMSYIMRTYIHVCGSGSSLDITTDYWLDGPGVRIPVRRDFSPSQTGPGAHPASYTMSTGSFPGVKYGRSVLLTTQPLLVPWSWKSRAIPLLKLWVTTWPVKGALYLLPLNVWPISLQYFTCIGPVFN